MSNHVRFVSVIALSLARLAGTADVAGATMTNAAPATPAQVGVQVDPCLWQVAQLANTAGTATQATDDSAAATIGICQAAANWLSSTPITDHSGYGYNALQVSEELNVLALYLSIVPPPTYPTAGWTAVLTLELANVREDYARLIAYAG